MAKSILAAISLVCLISCARAEEKTIYENPIQHGKAAGSWCTTPCSVFDKTYGSFPSYYGAKEPAHDGKDEFRFTMDTNQNEYSFVTAYF